MAPTHILQLFRVLAGSGQSDLRQQNQYLRAENQILRSKIAGPVRVTPAERARLVRLGKPLGPAVQSLVTIVGPAPS
jgi:putative transposase